MLFRLLKNVKKWVFKSLQPLADAEDRFVKSMFEEEIDNESY
jgi:hypothetical protein